MKGMLAPLSPNEEKTLRLIALGVGMNDVAESHLGRLRRLDLVEVVDGVVRLTDLGVKRSNGTGRPDKWISDTV